jgi:hypothetical protein
MIPDAGRAFMLIRRFVGCGFRVVCGFLICCVVSLSGYAAAGQQKPATEVPPAPPNPVNEAKQISCPDVLEDAIPTNSTIKAKVAGTLEASHQKAGKKLWLNSIYEMDFPGCRMLAGAPIYGIVTAASSNKNPDSSELSLQFNAADCVGHDKRPIKLVVVGVFAPPDEQARGHNALPTEVAGGARQISDAAASSNGYDANLNPAGPRLVSPGSIVGFKNLKLEPQGGPQCSARFSSTNRNLLLPTGTVLLLTVQSDKE